MRRDYRERAENNFSSRLQVLDEDLKRMQAEHAGQGLLRSGATIKRAVQLWENHSRAALDGTLDELSMQIEHRGKAWQNANDQISIALEAHINDALSHINKPMNLALAQTNSAARKATMKLIDSVAQKLKTRHQDFRDGWTAPRAKTWKERHPNFDRLLFIVIGAIVALGIGQIAGFLSSPS